MELMKVETKEINNSELKRDLTILNEVFSGVRANQKQIASIIGHIISLEMYKDDFDKLSDFLSYIRLNKSTASQFKKFVEYTTEDLRESDFSYSQIVEMFPLVDSGRYGSLSIDITELIDVNNSMTCREIREIVKEFINYEVEVDEAEAEEAEAEAEAESNESEEVIDYTFYIDYLTSLEVGMELTKEDVKILKQIAKELR